MPSGMPSSVRHNRATDAVLSLVSVNPGRAPAARAAEQPDRLVRRLFGAAGAVRRQVQRRHPPHRLAPHPQRLPGWSR